MKYQPMELLQFLESFDLYSERLYIRTSILNHVFFIFNETQQACVILYVCAFFLIM